jgi:hypothetical protein
VDLVHVEHKKTIMRILPQGVATAVFNIPDEYLTLNADELEQLTPKKKFTHTDNKLRISFWKEHTRAIAQMSNTMNMMNVVRGICSRAHLEQMLVDKVRLAYLILPPPDYDVAMEEFTNYSLDTLRECFDVAKASFMETKDPKMYESLRKTLEMLIVHTKGEPIRRVENKNLNMNVDAGRAVGAMPATMEEIDAKLRELEIEDAQLVGERPMIVGPPEETR